MVKILSNGEIVPDDDPRARGSNRSQNQNQSSPRPRQGGIQQDAGGQPHYHMPQGSVFDGLNQRLLDAGVPRWQIFSYTVEPIASLGFLLALLFLGVRGLLFAGLLFFIVKYSNTGAGGGGAAAGGGGGFQGFMGGGGGGGGSPPQDGPGGQGGSNRPGRGWTGGGHRLGRR